MCITYVFLLIPPFTMFLFSFCFSFSQLNVASYLQMICLAENFRTDVKDFITLLTTNACDIRKSILYLQFWIRSGGGFLEERPLSICRKLICYKRNFYSRTLYYSTCCTKISERFSKFWASRYRVNLENICMSTLLMKIL